MQDGLVSARVVKKATSSAGSTTARRHHPVVATKDLKAAGWGGLSTKLELTDGGRTVPHSAKAGTVVGQLSVGSGPGRTQVPVALAEDLSEPGFGSKLTRVS
ncbi:hypothetical protein NKH77_31580 [Streptomyces sp. M19]